MNVKVIVEKMKKEDVMFKINENYLKLPGSYLFSTIGKKVKEVIKDEKE